MCSKRQRAGDGVWMARGIRLDEALDGGVCHQSQTFGTVVVKLAGPAADDGLDFGIDLPIEQRGHIAASHFFQGLRHVSHGGGECR